MGQTFLADLPGLSFRDSLLLLPTHESSPISSQKSQQTYGSYITSQACPGSIRLAVKSWYCGQHWTCCGASLCSDRLHSVLGHKEACLEPGSPD